jgi:predicted nuclease of predicted toxin-antitoxin system
VRLLFDENLSDRLARRLADCFEGSAHVKHMGLRRTPDIEIWQYAISHDYVIVSQDTDFRELARRSGPPPKVILITTGNSATRAVEALLRAHEGAIKAFATTDDSLLVIS